MNKFKYIFSAVALSAAISGNAQVDFEEQTQTTLKIPKLLNDISKMYITEVDQAELERNLVKGLYNGLKPFSLYQPSELIAKVKPGHKDNLQALGVSFRFKKDSLVIKEVFPNSAADLAGLKVGDKIGTINDKDFSKENYYIEVAERLIGNPGETLDISFSRDKSEMSCKAVLKDFEGYDLALYGIGPVSASTNNYKAALPYFDAIYPDSLTNGQITEFGIRYMLSHLDPHSSYISLEDLHDMESPLKGSFTGVGVRFQIDKDTIVVAQAIPGGPSEKVGIMAGDKFVYIDDELVASTGIKNSGVRERLLGEKGSKVKVKMYRAGEPELLEFIIERDKIPIYSLDTYYMAAPEVGYIKLNNFSATTVSEARTAINSLQRDGMKDLIIDLQNNGGGYLMTAVNLLDEIIADKKLLVYTEGRAFPRKNYTARKEGLMEKGRVIVLVNESSASASEIVSGAIQDWDRGLIIGRRTFSKGLVQKPVRLPDGTTVRITTSSYYIPSGRCIQKPYEKGNVEYRREKYNRYESGEMYHKDSIQTEGHADFKTRKKGRTVYDGCGIIPDVFVPLDTNSTSNYFSQLIRKGVYSKFALNYVNNNRKSLQKKYPTFAQFKKNFNSEKVAKELFDFGVSKGVEFDKQGYKDAEQVILVRLKAQIAQNLFDIRKYYEVINDLNDPLQKALEVLEDEKEFDQLR